MKIKEERKRKKKIKNMSRNLGSTVQGDRMGQDSEWVMRRDLIGHQQQIDKFCFQ